MTLIIRHTEPQDAAGIKALYAQPSCFAGTLQLPYPSDQLWEQRLNTQTDNHHSLVALLEQTIVGQLGVQVCSQPRRKHVANLGMGVSENHRGQGIGNALLTEAIDLAMNWLAVTRMELEVYTDNAPAIALYQKHGFIIEGTAKKYAFRNGEYVDTHFMAKVS